MKSLIVLKIEDYQKSVSDLKKEDFSSKLKNGYPEDEPDDEEIERTMEITKLFIIKNGEELTEIYLKSDVLLLACVFEKFIKISFIEYGINPLYCVNLPGYTWQLFSSDYIYLSPITDETLPRILFSNNKIISLSCRVCLRNL